MFKAYNILTNSIEDVAQSTIVEQHDTSCIIGIPHDGHFVPIEYNDHYQQGRVRLIDVDLYTKDIHTSNIGTVISFTIAPFVVNLARAPQGLKGPDVPKHLMRGPLHTMSLLGGQNLQKEYSEQQKEVLLGYYHEYHNALQELVDSMKRECGYALIFDGHAMLGRGLMNVPDEGKERADICVGDLDGTSADPQLVDFFAESIQRHAKRAGLSVAFNKPYKGGYITQKYSGQENVNVFQIEVKKETYMTPLYEDAVEGEGTFLAQKAKNVQEVLHAAYKETAQYAMQTIGTHQKP